MEIFKIRYAMNITVLYNKMVTTLSYIPFNSEISLTLTIDEAKIIFRNTVCILDL